MDHHRSISGSYFHQTRYGHRPPPHHVVLPNNPTIYPHHHNQSTLQHPPQQFRPPQQHPTPPPPHPPPLLQPYQQHHHHQHPFNPQNPHFSFNFNQQHSRSHPDVVNFPQSPSSSARLPSDFIGVDRSDFRDPPRFLPPRSCLHHPSDLHQQQQQSVSPIAGRRELGFIEEQKQQQQQQRLELLFGSNSDRSSSRDFRIALSNNQINHAMPFDDVDDDERRSESHRWLHHGREAIRDVHDSFIDRRSNEITGDSDGNRIVKHYRSSREVSMNAEHSSGGKGSSREGSYEFNNTSNRTPRKTLQKKSALLRIQKPVHNFRIRDDDRGHHYSGGYFDDSKFNTSFRGNKDRDKDQNQYRSDRGTGEQVREGSPVELDVSFKSNSLVAKAIVTPSADVSDSNLAPSSSRNGKLRKALVPNKDSLTPPIKPSEGKDVVSVANITSTSDKDLKHSKKEAKACGSIGTEVSPGMSKGSSTTKGTVLNKGGASVSGKTSSLKVSKKKKITKRPVKKAINPNFNSSGSQQTKKCDESVIVDSSVHVQPESCEPEMDAIATSVNIVDSQPCSNETTLKSENARVEEFSEAMASENGITAGSGRLCMPNVNRKRSRPTSPLGSSSLEGITISENVGHDNSMNYTHVISNTHKDHTHDDSMNYIHVISNTDNDHTKLPNETIGSDTGGAEDAVQQLCLSGESLWLENNAASRSPKSLLSAKENANCVSEKIEIHENPANSCDMILGYESDNALLNITAGTTVSDNGSIDVGWKQPCTDEGSPAENNFVDSYVDSHFSVGNSQNWLCSSGEMTLGNVARSASPSDEGVGTIFGSDNGCHILGKNSLSNHKASISKQLSPDRVGISFESAPIGGSLNQMVSMGSSEEVDTLNSKKSDTKVERSELDLSMSEADDVHTEPENVVNSACWVDTTLRLSFKDPNPTECTVSGKDSGNIGLQPFTDGFSVLSQISSTGISQANVSVTSSVNVCPNSSFIQKQKKRKVSGSQLELYCPMPSLVTEGPPIADISASSVEVPSNSGGDLTQPEVEATVSSMDPLCKADFPVLSKITVSLNCLGEEYDSNVSPFRDASEDDEVLAVPKVKSICQTGTQGEQMADVNPVMAGISHHNNSIHAESGGGVKMDVEAAEEQPIVDIGITLCEFSSELKSLNSDERLPSVNVEDENCHHVKNCLTSESNNLSSLRDGNGVPTADISGEAMGPVPDTSSDMDCQEMLPGDPSNTNDQFSIEKSGGDDEILLGKPAIQSGSSISAVTSGLVNTEFNLNLDHAVENAHSSSGKTITLHKSGPQTLNAVNREISGGKNRHSHAASRIYPGHSSLVFTASKNTTSSNHISKPRTWHRTDSSSGLAPPGNKAFSSTVPTQSQLPKKVAIFQSPSYIRKGNSLVRKPTSVALQSRGSSSAVYRLNSSGTDEVKKNAGCENRTGVADPSNGVRSGMNISLDMPRTPPLPCSTKIPKHYPSSLGDCQSSPLASLNNCATETASDPMTYTESHDVLKSSEDAIKISGKLVIQTGQINNLDCHTEQNDGNVVPSNANSITYVKRKSNQLVAASNPSLLSMKNSHGAPTLPSDSYYKRRKNQLIRTSLESHVKSTASIPDETMTTEGQTLHNYTSIRNLTKRRLRKVLAKTRKPSKFSLVWTLRSAQLLNNDGNSLHHQKALPQLFPWKRAASWRSFIPSLAANSINGSTSTIRKLLLSRKRDTVYTRSKHGFSLRKSKVLSVGGSSLKWSKSIERQSKKANEEATLAVAEAERKKREQIGASYADYGTKNRNSSSRKSVHTIKLHPGSDRGDPGERIFRIGSVRYKMDSSKRTLQRVSDDESSHSEAVQTEKDAKRSYVPRRLVIGKDEYVRIGNGNQLVRDPKKRARILASEKVRWSLHTARSRLAKKRKYCQFFTRFGKCNKDDGKCPYIHDSSKIAVCTKFLNGLCFNPDCKLTHKVIPERMPDCCYFLQGLCSNKSCPYRHVHVNPSASMCGGFLRGYCADGNECRKKHSYVCPTYEATGSCPHGSKCKLHHPKIRSKGKKSKQLREKKKNAQGRYFGLMLNASQSGTAVSEKYSVQDNGNFCFEGSIADYISLDGSEEDGESSNPADQQTSFSDNDTMDLQSADLDELIKPIRIMTA